MGIEVLRSFWRRNWVAYLFLSPWFIGLVTLTMIPMVTSMYLSFTNYDLFTSPNWIGLDNYIGLIDDPHYFKSLQVTGTYVFIGVPFQLMFALALALLLNRGLRGLKLYRAVYYIPSLLGGSVAIALMWRKIFGGEGVINTLLSHLGLEGVNMISSPSTAIYTLIILHAWQFGSAMVIFLAGLKQIPLDLYEAAAIDGANKRNQFIKITFPLLTPIIFFNAVMQLISTFQAFTSAYIVSGGTGGPLNSTLFYTLYLYKQGFTYFQMGYASAMAWVLLLIIAFFTALLFLSSRKWVYYEQ